MNTTHFITGFILLFLIAAGMLAIRNVGSNKGAEAPQGAITAQQDERVLDLRGQGLKKVPEYVLSLTRLEELDLSGNALGALPAEIRHLQNLRVLDLSDNRLTGVPAEIGQLRKLEILDLSDNLLTGLPHELGNLQKLRLLDLSGNDYAEADLAIIRGKLPESAVIKID